jgi:hypothetical protein
MDTSISSYKIPPIFTSSNTKIYCSSAEEYYYVSMAQKLAWQTANAPLLDHGDMSVVKL